jgi:hypothetical protein
VTWISKESGQVGHRRVRLMTGTSPSGNGMPCYTVLFKTTDVSTRTTTARRLNRSEIRFFTCWNSSPRSRPKISTPLTNFEGLTQPPKTC